MFGWLGAGLVAGIYEAWALRNRRETMTAAVKRAGSYSIGRILLAGLWVWVTIHFHKAVTKNQKEMLKRMPIE